MCMMEFFPLFPPAEKLAVGEKASTFLIRHLMNIIVGLVADEKSQRKGSRCRLRLRVSNHGMWSPPPAFL